MRSLYTLSIRALLAGLGKGPLGKISTDLYAMSLCKNSIVRGLLARSLCKLSIKDLLVKISAQDLLDYQNEHRATTRAMWHDLTGPNWREGCARDLKIRTAPQRERSDTPSVTRGLRERTQNERCPQRERSDPHRVTRGLRKRSQNEHRATTRAICHAQSHDRVARAHVRFSQNIAHTTNMKAMSYLGLDLFFVEVCKVLRLPRKMNPGHPKCCTCHNGIISLIMSKINNDDRFTKRDFRPFQNVVQVHQTLHLPWKNDLQNCLWFWTTQGAESATPAPHSKCPESATPATHCGHSAR